MAGYARAVGKRAVGFSKFREGEKAWLSETSLAQEEEDMEGIVDAMELEATVDDMVIEDQCLTVEEEEEEQEVPAKKQEETVKEKHDQLVDDVSLSFFGSGVWMGKQLTTGRL